MFSVSVFVREDRGEDDPVFTPTGWTESFANESTAETYAMAVCTNDKAFNEQARIFDGACLAIYHDTDCTCVIERTNAITVWRGEEIAPVFNEF